MYTLALQVHTQGAINGMSSKTQVFHEKEGWRIVQS